ncbi:hypothetical protein MPC4_290039 [Methylocella tundrae]|uniref:Uncharacterized protein n=1 Tax=Methylocella tundrae TaxID=227605 RepID=A0A8B6M9D4_METTU|nr:hypothetical protein MPC1_9800002 [Methylocella tundrae]VTZ50792.1 hypothetical protein MPC4_290039 [Methylocella tundrae]
MSVTAGHGVRQCVVPPTLSHGVAIVES